MNYYEILEIDENASTEVIKAAYRALAKKYHPDTYRGSNASRDKNMSQINEAYEVLSDEQKRKDYDRKIKSQNKTSNDFHKEEACQPENQSYSDCQENYDNSSCDYQNEQSSYTENESCETSEEVSGGWFGKFVRNVGKGFIKSMQNNNREIENAYLDGLTMDDYLLVKKFKQSSGYKRVGYVKALEEKGLLERDYDGKLVPTYRFKQLF
ncbi:MAG: DnaJ domain-containing protein [Clostridia bacterium]|nr:DnaJ domain-containing protein [Clostridia bacterium]